VNSGHFSVACCLQLYAVAMETDQLNDLSYRIIGAGVEVHRALGPGLLESTYRACMIHELRARKMRLVTEHVIPIRYKNLILTAGIAST
jgi:GxxExxY protein